MPRVTKAMLESDIAYYREQNINLKLQIQHVSELNNLLKTRQFDVNAFCHMHEETIGSITHVVSDLKQLLHARGLK